MLDSGRRWAKQTCLRVYARQKNMALACGYGKGVNLHFLVSLCKKVFREINAYCFGNNIPARRMRFRVEYELIITLTKKKSNTLFEVCNMTSKI